MATIRRAEGGVATYILLLLKCLMMKVLHQFEHRHQHRYHHQHNQHRWYLLSCCYCFSICLLNSKTTFSFSFSFSFSTQHLHPTHCMFTAHCCVLCWFFVSLRTTVHGGLYQPRRWVNLRKLLSTGMRFIYLKFIWCAYFYSFCCFFF